MLAWLSWQVQQRPTVVLALLLVAVLLTSATADANDDAAVLERLREANGLSKSDLDAGIATWCLGTWKLEADSNFAYHISIVSCVQP